MNTVPNSETQLAITRAFANTFTHILPYTPLHISLRYSNNKKNTFIIFRILSSYIKCSFINTELVSTFCSFELTQSRSVRFRKSLEVIYFCINSLCYIFFYNFALLRHNLIPRKKQHTNKN